MCMYTHICIYEMLLGSRKKIKQGVGGESYAVVLLFSEKPGKHLRMNRLLSRALNEAKE